MTSPAKPTNEHIKIFISYSRHDANITLSLADGLREDAYTVWTDVNGIPGGAVWLYEIEAAIAACDIFIAMISRNAKASEWVRREILFALDLKKRIIPIRLEEITLPFALYDLQPVDHFTTPVRTIQHLRNVLNGLSSRIITPSPISIIDTKPDALDFDHPSLVNFRRHLIERSHKE